MVRFRFVSIPFVICHAFVVLAVLTPSRAVAQAGIVGDTSAFVSESFDVTFGPSAVRGGPKAYTNRGGIAIEFVYATRRPARQGWMRAIAVGARGIPLHDLACVFEFPERKPLPCARPAPSIYHVAIASGYEFRRGGSSLRAMLGPSLYFDSHHPGIGARAHVSAAVSVPLVALTFGLNSHALVLSDGTRYHVLSVAIGARAQ